MRKFIIPTLFLFSACSNSQFQQSSEQMVNRTISTAMNSVSYNLQYFISSSINNAFRK